MFFKFDNVINKFYCCLKSQLLIFDRRGFDKSLKLIITYWKYDIKKSIDVITNWQDK